MQLVLKTLNNFQPTTHFLGVLWYLLHVLIFALDCLYPFLYGQSDHFGFGFNSHWKLLYVHVLLWYSISISSNATND